nr:marine proteobacterial sortase target protein [Gammaproteobacteria bacterium]
MNMNTGAHDKALPICKIFHKNQGFYKDLLVTLAAALWTGFTSSVLFVLLVFISNGEARADEDQQGSGGLALYTLDGRRVEDAPRVLTNVQIEVTGMLARVKVHQQYTNPGGEWLEGVYQFPLPENSAVDELRMRIGERLLLGEIQEQAQAKTAYETAKAKGQRASLLNMQRPNLFSTRLANIGPGESIQVEITYQQILTYQQGWFHLRLPLVVGPRYIPGRVLTGSDSSWTPGVGWASDTDQVPDASHISPPVADPLKGLINPLTLSLRLNPGVELDSIHSSSHDLQSLVDDQGIYHLGPTSQTIPADRDFVLQWKPKADLHPRTVVFREAWEGHEYALLMMLPPKLDGASSESLREVIFVVDTSGSMLGTSIHQAKAALELALTRLSPTAHFNVIQFNSRVHSLFNRTVPATRRNLELALTYVQGLQAEGGTEMFPAITRALQDESLSGHLRQVIFLTDGSVGNERALFGLIQQKLGNSRFFPIGIGSAPNSYFMRQAAEFGRGSFSYIGDLAEVEERMSDLFEKLAHPVLTDIQLIWDDDRRVESFPKKIMDLYRGEPLMVILKADELPHDLTLMGEFAGSEWQQQLAIQNLVKQPGIHKLW